MKLISSKLSLRARCKIFCFVDSNGLCNGYPALSFQHESCHSRENRFYYYFLKSSCVPVKLYLQKQIPSQIWPMGHFYLIFCIVFHLSFSRLIVSCMNDQLIKPFGPDIFLMEIFFYFINGFRTFLVFQFFLSWYYLCLNCSVFFLISLPLVMSFILNINIFFLLIIHVRDLLFFSLFRGSKGFYYFLQYGSLIHHFLFLFLIPCSLSLQFFLNNQLISYQLLPPLEFIAILFP